MASPKSHNIGTTCSEVESILGQHGRHVRHQSVSARRTELRAAGYTDYLLDGQGQPVRRPTESGRLAYVEIATRLGKDAIRLGWDLHLRGGDPTAGHHGGNPMSAGAFDSINNGQRQYSAREVLSVMALYSP